MERYQVLKNGIPVAVTATLEEAEDLYAKHDADDIREIEDEEN